MSNQYVGLSDKEIIKRQRNKLREGISAGTHLSVKEIKRLNKLGEGISLSLNLDLTIKIFQNLRFSVDNARQEYGVLGREGRRRRDHRLRNARARRR